MDTALKSLWARAAAAERMANTARYRETPLKMGGGVKGRVMADLLKVAKVSTLIEGRDS
jgi:hypothetical protein